MKFLEKKLNRNLVLTCILFIGLVLAVITCRYHANKFLIDDMLSFSLANTPGGWVSHEVLGWINNQEFYRFAVIDNPFDFKNVWLNQALDCHPPLYYLIIHIICSFFSPALSYWYGYIPNIIFYLLTAVVVQKLSYKLSGDYLLSFLVMLVYVINPTVLNYVAFIRMYPLVGLLGVLFAYLAIDFFDDDRLRGKHYYLITLICALGCLTHYYSYVIYFFISLTVGLYLLFKKKYKQLILYCVSVLAGIIIALLIFPSAINHWLNNPHSVNAVNNFNDSVNTLSRYTKYLEYSPFKLFTAVFIVGLIILAIKSKKLNLKHFSLLFTGLMYFLLIGKTSSFVTHRYMVPIDGIFISGFISSSYVVIKNLKIKLILTLGLIISAGFPTIYIKDYQNPVSYAKAHYGDLLIVYSDQYWDSNYINVNAFEFREYENIYLMNNSEEARQLKADFFMYKKAVVYVAHEMDLNVVKNWLFGSSRFTKLEPVGINTALYAVYYAVE